VSGLLFEELPFEELLFEELVFRKPLAKIRIAGNPAAILVFTRRSNVLY